MLLHRLIIRDQDSSVGIATNCGLDDAGFETRPHPSRLALMLTQPPIQWLTLLFRVVKRSGYTLNTHTTT